MKFANAQPTDSQCEKILEFGIAIVRSTTPGMARTARPSGVNEASATNEIDGGEREPRANESDDGGSQ